MAETFRKFDDSEIEIIFCYHAPTAEQRETYEKINAAFVACAKAIIPLLPDGEGKMVAVRKLSDARMSANASVALEGKF